MVQLLDRVRKFLDMTLQTVCALLLVALTIDVSWQVFCRYCLNSPSAFTDELARFLMIWLGMLGACLLFGKNGHLALNLLFPHLSATSQRILRCVIYLMVLAFVFAAMGYGGAILIQRTIFQISPAIHIPMGCIYSILPISAVLISIYMGLNIYDVLSGRTAALEDNSTR